MNTHRNAPFSVHTRLIGNVVAPNNVTVVTERRVQAFEHAYMTPLAMILIDDVERLLEYANVCNSVKFSNMVLQALLVLLKRRPPSRCRLMVVVTTSVLRHLQLLHLDAAFYSVVHVPELAEPDEFKAVLKCGRVADSHAHTFVKPRVHVTLLSLARYVVFHGGGCVPGSVVLLLLLMVTPAATRPAESTQRWSTRLRGQSSARWG